MAEDDPFTNVQSFRISISGPLPSPGTAYNQATRQRNEMPAKAIMADDAKKIMREYDMKNPVLLRRPGCTSLFIGVDAKFV